MWGQYHEVSYNSKVEERIIGPLSFSKLAWIVPGIILSVKFAKMIPKLPIDSLLFSRIHWFIPLIICIIFAYFRDEQTNLSLYELIKTKIAIRRRRRVFYYRRQNMPKWEELK